MAAPASRALAGSALEGLWRRGRRGAAGDGSVGRGSPGTPPPTTATPARPPGGSSPELGRFAPGAASPWLSGKAGSALASAGGAGGAVPAPRGGLPATTLSWPGSAARRRSRGSLGVPELPDFGDGGVFGGGGGGSDDDADVGGLADSPPTPAPARGSANADAWAEMPPSPGDRRFRASYWQCVAG
jgi:hypothetical protein